MVLRAGALAAMLRARVGAAFFATGTRFAPGVRFDGGVRLAAGAGAAPRFTPDVAAFFGVFAAVAPVARLVAVATFLARAARPPGDFLAPVAFRAAAGRVAVRVAPPRPPPRPVCVLRPDRSPSPI